MVKECFLLMKYFIFPNFSVFLFFILTTPLYADEAQIYDDSPVRDLATELYKNYETIDKELNELKKAAGEPQADSLMAPFVISVKKAKGFRLISIDVHDEGKPIWGHIYNDMENTALDSDGRHEIYRGVAKKGKHSLSLAYQYQLHEDKKDASRSGVVRETLDITAPSYMEVFFKKDDKDIKVYLRKYE